MEINKQLFEDVLSGKLKGTFVLRNGNKVKSSELEIDPNANVYYYPIFLNGIWYTFRGELHLMRNNDLDIIDFISDTNMKENELTIEIPDNKVVDWDESKKQNKIVLKDKQVTYKDICKKLFENKEFFFTNAIGTIESSSSPVSTDLINAVNNSTSYHQLECILAKNKLANVARYLNGEWKPIHGTSVWIIERNFHSEYYAEPIKVGSMAFDCYGLVIFKSSELAEQAIEILGEETVKLALEPLGI